MTYTPAARNKVIIDMAKGYVDSVPYQVTARWVFYRLLQEGLYSEKAGYKHLLGLLSKARKEFYNGWHPATLADDSRAAVVRGGGYTNPAEWLRALQERSHCAIDRWQKQPVYTECWFEASAMSAQFDHYADGNISLLAFHGDISIPEKWKAAERLARRYILHQKPIKIFYYGDYDPKGMEIPYSAWRDIYVWTLGLIKGEYNCSDALVARARDDIDFERIGLNPGHEVEYDIPENPERPGTFQWEALRDEQARVFIERANGILDYEALWEVDAEEERATAQFRTHLQTLEL